jgi:hypothetical protein
MWDESSRHPVLILMEKWNAPIFEAYRFALNYVMRVEKIKGPKKSLELCELLR